MNKKQIKYKRGFRMSLWSKSKEGDPDKQSSGLLIIRHDFKEGELIYKYPVENLTNGSQVYLQMGQEALLIVDGALKRVFSQANMHTIETNDLYMPGGAKSTAAETISRPFSGGLITNAVVLFINKDKDIKVRWGTPRAIAFESAKYQSVLHMQARGSLTLVVDSSPKLYSRVLGQLRSYSATDIGDFIFEKVIQIITDKIAKALQQSNVLFSQLQSHTLELSGAISDNLRQEEIFESYGLKMRGDISISSMTLSEEDEGIVKQYDAQLREISLEGRSEANAILVKGMAEAEVMKSKGNYYAMERSYDVLEAAAKNEGGANVGGGTNLMTASIGMGMGAGLAQGFGQAMGNVAGTAFAPQAQNSYIQPQVQPQPLNIMAAGIVCSKCGTENVGGSKFCNGCGEKFEISQPIMRFCSQCGSSITPESKFCNNCGFKIRD